MEIFESNCTNNVNDKIELIKLNNEQYKNGQHSLEIIRNNVNVDRSIFSEAESNDNNNRKRFKSVHYYQNNNNNNTYIDHYDGQALMIADDQFLKKQTATSKLLNTSSSQMYNNFNVEQSMHNPVGLYNNNPLHHQRFVQADVFNGAEGEQQKDEINNNDAEDNHPSCSSYLSSNVEKIRRHANTFISVCSTGKSLVSFIPMLSYILALKKILTVVIYSFECFQRLNDSYRKPKNTFFIAFLQDVSLFLANFLQIHLFPSFILSFFF